MVIRSNDCNHTRYGEELAEPINKAQHRHIEHDKYQLGITDGKTN